MQAGALPLDVERGMFVLCAVPHRAMASRTATHTTHLCVPAPPRPPLPALLLFNESLLQAHTHMGTCSSATTHITADLHTLYSQTGGMATHKCATYAQQHTHTHIESQTQTQTNKAKY